MKKIILSIALTFISLGVSASIYNYRFQTGSFQMFSERNHTPSSCGSGIRLVLDKAEIKGKIAFLNEFVEGLCEIYIMPVHRFYEIKEVANAGCNSTLLKAQRVAEDGVHQLEIIDHRTRTCRDLQPNQIVMKEIAPNGSEVTTYSYHGRIRPF